jgi:aminopeptidase
MEFQQQLEALAQLTVRVGNNLQPGQRLLVRAPLEAAPLVRLVTRAAYDAGARLVDVLWSDEGLVIERLRHSRSEFMTEVSEVVYGAQDKVVQNGDAYLAIIANDPGALEAEDSERISTMMRAAGERGKANLEAFGAGAVNWCVIACAVPKWARRIFPDLNEDEAMRRLWGAIFTATRSDQPDPVAAWQSHVDSLEARRDFLNAQRLTALEFKAPGTDLRIELPEAHRWQGGSVHTKSGTRYVPNMPTDEIFTCPHREGVSGTVRASKPLGYSGKIIEGINMIFKDGRAVTATATANEDALRRLLETDEGAARLGEVALVAASSPVAKTGLLFQETLFDENAACHIAQGRAYQNTLEDGSDLSKDAFRAAGGNDSQIHVDWMIGSTEMQVSGVRPDGSRMALLEDGEWAFQP